MFTFIIFVKKSNPEQSLLTEIRFLNPYMKDKH